MSVQGDPLSLSVTCPKCARAPHQRCQDPGGRDTPTHQTRTSAALAVHPVIRRLVLRAAAAELLSYAASAPMHGSDAYWCGREDGRAEAAEYVRRLADG